MSAQSPLPQEGSPVQDVRPARPMPHTPGFADAFGSRQLVFDPATSTSLEVLRFKREFSESPDFEGALLARVEALSHVRHASLGNVQSVERSSDTELALVSRHTPGRRVSELLPKAHGPAFALELIRLVTPALATLQRAGEDVSHGTLSADRIVVTRDGRLVVVEHVLGSALEAMHVTRKQMIELGLVAPATSELIQFTSRTDIAQLGYIALALLLGRKLDPADYPEKVPAFLDEFARTAGSPILAAKLRTWLERAMQISTRSFASAEDAAAAMSDLPDETDVQAATMVTGLDAFPQEATRPPAPVAAAAPATMAFDAAHHEEPVERRGPVADRRSPAKKSTGKVAMVIVGLLGAGAGGAYFALPMLKSANPSDATTQNPIASLATLDPSVTAAPQVQSAVPPPATTPVATPAPLTTPIAQGAAAAGAPLAASVLPSQTPAPTTTATAAASTAAAAAPVATQTPAPGAPTRFGGLTVKSSMELQVFENGSAIGSTAGPIAIGDGSRTVEFVNDALGFRYRQSVTIKAGQMTTVNIATPNGKVSINAAPWAEVDIDGKPAGETPLANLTLPIGSHEITFRHPQLGTKKQTVIVKVEGLTKVTEVFKQEPGR